MTTLTLTRVDPDIASAVGVDEDPDLALHGDDLLIAVEAAPINNADFLFAAGWFAVYPEVPNELGAEGVGRVMQAGPDADEALIGRRVIILPTFRHGTWAEQTVVPAGSVVPVPDDIDVRQLAMLAVNPATAYSLLNDYVQLRRGDWIGLTLANGAVGHDVIALAKRAGIKTLAVVRRPEVADEVLDLGADIVLVDGDDLGDRAIEALGDERLRLLLDGTGNATLVTELIGALENGGEVVAFSSTTNESPVIPLADLIYRGISLRSFLINRWIDETPSEELVRIYGELAELIREGVINVPVEATYTLDEYQEALAHAQRAGRGGKVLFTPVHA
jgi:NADPH:quinone reductase-like Zn-dependent oxidoreductase